jgi:hypothetical protein
MVELPAFRALAALATGLVLILPACAAPSVGRAPGPDFEPDEKDHTAARPGADAGSGTSTTDVIGVETTTDPDPAPGTPRTCTLGTSDDCGACGKRCAGTNTAQTAITCSDATAAGVCGVTCKGDSYDVDGDPANGCEALDGPDQSSAERAVPVELPTAAHVDINDQILVDERPHAAAPATREEGLPDWWKVTATGGGNPDKKMHACLFIGTLPADSVYQVCISQKGSNDPTVCRDITPTTPAGVTRCVFANDDAGTFYVRVARKAGTPTVNKFALYLEH